MHNTPSSRVSYFGMSVVSIIIFMMCHYWAFYAAVFVRIVAVYTLVPNNYLDVHNRDADLYHSGYPPRVLQHDCVQQCFAQQGFCKQKKMIFRLMAMISEYHQVSDHQHRYHDNCFHTRDKHMSNLAIIAPVNVLAHKRLTGKIRVTVYSMSPFANII